MKTLGEPHIQYDFDVVAPFYEEIKKRLLPKIKMPEARFHELVDEWRIEAGHLEFQTFMELAAQGDEIREEPQALARVSRATSERMQSMSKEGITTGPCSRMIMAIAEHHDELGIQAPELRGILKESAEVFEKSVTEILPTLQQFMLGFPAASVVGRA